MLDQREEVIIVGLLKAAADGEGEVDRIRSKMCEDPDFEPYTAFKALQQRPMTSGILTAKDVCLWLQRQYYKTTMLRERDVQTVLEHYGENGMLRYESFLKLVLPREDKRVRSLVMCRRTSSGMGMMGKELGRDAGYHFIRLLEQEAALDDELTLRKKRLLEYEWREDKEHTYQRAFTWLQSESAVPGVCHVSVLGVVRLLCDLKEIMTVTQVERLFHRINTSGTDMLSYVEFEKFMESREADAYLNELYVKYFATMCPGCGSMCQRDGGACNSVTCSFCRTSFRCETRADESDYGNLGMSPRSNYGGGYNMNNGSYGMNKSQYNKYPTSPRAQTARSASPRASPKGMSRSGLSTTASMYSPRLNETMQSSFFSPRASPSGYMDRHRSLLDESDNFQKDLSLMSTSPYGKRTGETSLSTYKRQRLSLECVLNTVFKMMEIDQMVEQEKENLWQSGVNLEAAFGFLDRYAKGYVADTDVWQIMHSEAPVAFSSVCQLFRDLKSPSARKQGQMNLAELTMFLFPRQSEEYQNVHEHMTDAETQNVLYVVRSTVSCPGCASRVQRTMEGCSSVTCPVCHTPFRCNLIGDDRDQEFRLTLTQKHKVRQYIKFASEAAEDIEQLRKNLLCDVDSLSTVLLDAFLMMSDDKGYISFLDFKKALLSERSLRMSDIELLWHRFARDRKRLGFVEFAQQIRPFGTS